MADIAKIIRNSAAWLASRHAQSPEVRAAGGAEAADADGFHDDILVAELREVGLAADQELVGALRSALRQELAALERERSDEAPAAAFGRKGGQSKSEAKTAAARANSSKAGRPRYIGCSLPGEIGIKIQGRRATICSNRGGAGRGYMEEGTMAEVGATGEDAYRKLASRLGWPDEVAAALWK